MKQYYLIVDIQNSKFAFRTVPIYAQKNIRTVYIIYNILYIHSALCDSEFRISNAHKLLCKRCDRMNRLHVMHSTMMMTGRENRYILSGLFSTQQYILYFSLSIIVLPNGIELPFFPLCYLFQSIIEVIDQIDQHL